MPQKLMPSIGMWTRPGSLAANPVPPSLVCDAAEFDGTNDYLIRATPMTGAEADGKKLIVSFWIYCAAYPSDPDQPGLIAVIGDDNDVTLSISLGSTGKIVFLHRNTSTFAQVAQAETADALVLDAWNHVAWSFDAALGQSAQRLRLNGLSALNSLDHADQNINWSDDLYYSVGADSAAGGSTPGNFKLGARLAELYIAPGYYLDLDVASNLEKLRTASGKPADLGATGASPTGAAPLIYLHLDDAEAAANFATNRSGNGNFTVTGTLATASSSPSD